MSLIIQLKPSDVALDLGFARNQPTYAAPRVDTEVADQLLQFIVLIKVTLVSCLAVKSAKLTSSSVHFTLNLGFLGVFRILFLCTLPLFLRF